MARAPGRLDVMGGIADYSGSLVLQVPFLYLMVISYSVFISLFLPQCSQHTLVCRYMHAQSNTPSVHIYRDCIN